MTDYKCKEYFNEVGWQRMQQGDKEEFDDFATFMIPWLIRYFRAALVNETEDAWSIAQELTQDTLFNAWKGIATFDPSKSLLTTWTFSIGTKKLTKIIQQCHNGDLSLDEYLKSKIFRSSLNVERIVEERDEQSRQELVLQKAIREKVISLEELNMFQLKEVHNMSSQEIAKQLHMTAGGVRKRLHDAKQRLNKWLQIRKK